MNNHRESSTTNVECTGFWWLPEDDSVVVGGTLAVSENGNITLSLLGTLGDTNPSDHLHVFKTPNTVLGVVDKNPLGQKITLTDCAQIHAAFGTGGNRESYSAGRGFFGDHLRAEGEFTFTSASVGFPDLTFWACPRLGLRSSTLRLDDDDDQPALSYRKPQEPLESADVSPGTIGLSTNIKFTRSVGSFHFTEHANFKFKCSPKSADEINAEFVYPLQNLMTFICDRAQHVDRFEVSNDQLDSPVLVVGPRVTPLDAKRADKPLNPQEMLVTFQDVEFQTLITNWVRLSERYRASCDVYFGLQYGPPAYLDSVFLGVVQALRLYHVARYDEYRESEAERFESIISNLAAQDSAWLIDQVGIRPFPPVPSMLNTLLDDHGRILESLIGSPRDRFTNRVMNTFHYLNYRDAGLDLAASHGADLYWLTQKLRFLLKACYLFELGLSAPRVEELLQRNRTFQHICEIEASED